MVPRNGQAGFDGIVAIGENLPSLWYLQCKVSLPVQSLERSIASSLCHCLLDHIRRAPAVPIGDVHLVLYVWGCVDGAAAGVEKEAVSALVCSQLTAMGESSALAPGVDEACVRGFVELHWGNVHIVGDSRLRQWLPESFLPFPMLFARLHTSTAA